MDENRSLNSNKYLESLGIVVIGRNEGERLQRCLDSLQGKVEKIVYVDSGSTDDSLLLAKRMGVTTVALDLSIPFTAARARNIGFKHLLSLDANIQYVQFVDGDCEVIATWLNNALDFLIHHSDCAVVCGRRRERFPQKTIYNQLCDWEWDGPTGIVKACGGDAMMRVDALLAVTGYRDGLIAGEEPELCVRLRGAGWQIWRLSEEMTLHDAAMFKFSQWWKRSIRGGYAFAAGCYLHGFTQERHSLLESSRIWLWGGVIPIVILSGSVLVSPWVLLAFGVYLLQILRLALRFSPTNSDAWLYAFFMVICKFPELVGQVKFIISQLKGTKEILIEYK
ncbi:glycosyltransferase family 2 protein [Methylomonas sp. AM2-LC]|uniref:glycosyltransferase family 2 protein n=1 Tax=Methylomonas sp. AM2-LC TaxID=3153301 RepID=UPI003265E723